MKNIFCAICGGVSSIALFLLGDINVNFIILLVFMCIDYISGLVMAGIFKKSGKSESGGLSSKAGWIGLVKKCLTLIMVIIANMLDTALNVGYIRNAVIIGFSVNELISIVENMGVMGVPIPSVITKAIDILKDKGESEK